MKEITYEDLLEAERTAKASHRQFRLLLCAAGYEEIEYQSRNGMAVVAVCPDYLEDFKMSVNSWQKLKRWCDSVAPHAYFIVEGSL